MTLVGPAAAPDEAPEALPLAPVVAPLVLPEPPLAPLADPELLPVDDPVVAMPDDMPVVATVAPLCAEAPLVWVPVDALLPDGAFEPLIEAPDIPPLTAPLPELLLPPDELPEFSVEEPDDPPLLPELQAGRTKARVAIQLHLCVNFIGEPPAINLRCA
jgi:hypothetical protein